MNTLSTSRRWIALGILCLSLLLAVVDNTIVNVALPTPNQELGASTTELQWVVDAYTLVFSALLLTMGHFGDRFGRKRILQLGLVIFAVTSALAAFSTTSGQLIGARALMGIGAAMIFPATLAILVNIFTDPKERAAAIGIWTAMVGVAVTIGPIAGGLLLEHFAWGSIFLVNIPVVVIAIVLGAIFLPESRDPKVGRMDYRGLVLSAAGVGLVIWAIIEAPKLGWTSVAFLSALIGGLFLLVVFTLVERRLEHPMLDVRLFKNARFTAASLSVTTAFFALFGFIFLITRVPAVGAGLLAPRGRYSHPAVRNCDRHHVAAGYRADAQVRLEGDRHPRIAGDGSGLPHRFHHRGRYSLLRRRDHLDGDDRRRPGSRDQPGDRGDHGALPPEQAGAGSAVNDTTREFGGTLGVAIVGSVFLSVYSAKVIDGYRSLGLPEQYESVVRESMGGGLGFAGQLAEGPADQLAAFVKSAFIDGLALGSLVSAVVVIIGAAVALKFLPARAKSHEDSPV